MVIPIINVRKGKPGSKGKTTKKPGLEVVKEELNIYDEMAAQVLEKYNQNHDARGRFAPSTGGAAGKIVSPATGSGDLPSWMEAKPKTTVTAPVEEKPGYKPWKKLPDNTYLPDSDGKYPYPDAPKARLDLKPFVGQEKPMEYWAENIGGRSFTDPSLKTRCIRDVKVQGVKAPVAHVWAQKPSSELMAAKWGQEQKAIGVVTAYAKGKHGEPKKMDYSIQPVRATINKEMPLLDADELIARFGHLIEKYNQNHDARGRFAPSTGGAAGGKSVTAPAGMEEMSLYDDILNPERAGDQEFAGQNVKLLNNDSGVPDEEALQVAYELDTLSQKIGNDQLRRVEITELPDQILAECNITYSRTGKNHDLEETIRIDPGQKAGMKQMYAEDRALIAKGEQPWLANGYAANEKQAEKAVMIHELGHGLMAQRVIQMPEKQWADKENPMMGDKKWETAVKTAATLGWQGPSGYGKTDLGECFAESLALLTVKSSTGDKGIDDYVLGAIKHA
jgi:hypothetical protein